MLHELLRFPITGSNVLVPVDVIAALFTIWALLARPRSLTRTLVRVGALVVGSGIGLALVWWFGDVQDAFGVAFTPVTRMWVAFACAGILLLLVVLVQGGWVGRVVAVVAAASLVLAAGLGVNVDFGFYKNVEQAIATNPYKTRDLAVRTTSNDQLADLEGWHAPTGMPKKAETFSVTIPGTVSHFHARKAVVWLPPAAQVKNPPALPVLVALSGQPGEPADLFQTGDIGSYLDRYAAAHDGLAPIVVAPDQLGAPNRNPMCVDSRRLGRSETYVVTDTVDWIQKHLPVSATPSGWGVVGFSEGATCAMQFTAEHPDVFGSALAISSEIGPKNGSVQHTIAVGFHGSTAAYEAAMPVNALRAHGKYTNHLIVFGVGGDDAPYKASTAVLRAASEKQGIATKLVVSPGSAHDWNTVRYVLANGLPAVLQHLGLPASGPL